VFKKIELQLNRTHYKGKTFTILAKGNISTNIYIQSARLNGKPYTKSYLDLDDSDIVNGGELELVMGNQANKNWGIN